MAMNKKTSKNGEEEKERINAAERTAISWRTGFWYNTLKGPTFDPLGLQGNT